MCWLIKRQCTGGPISFSKRLGISKSTFYARLDHLKGMDMDIKFSRKKNTYYFETDKGDYIVGFGRKIKGGYFIPKENVIE